MVLSLDHSTPKASAFRVIPTRFFPISSPQRDHKDKHRYSLFIESHAYRIAAASFCLHSRTILMAPVSYNILPYTRSFVPSPIAARIPT